MTRDKVERRIGSLRAKLSAAGVTHVAMYGSRARNEHCPESDLDLLIETDPERTFSLLDLIGVRHTIGDEIGLEVNVAMRRSLKPDFATEIAGDIREIF